MRSRLLLVLAVMLMALALPTAAVAGSTTRISTDSSGAQADNESAPSSVSANGRYIAFRSAATNLVPGDTNGRMDIFLKDTATGSIVRVSTGSSGGQSNDDSFEPSISADGRYVAFQSNASNLVPGDTNNEADIFLKDTTTGTITRVSTDSSGGQLGRGSLQASISGDGRFVAFVTDDTNGLSGIFVKDTVTGATRRVSTDSSGAQGSFQSMEPSISADGRYVAFASGASNLVPSDTNGAQDVFVKDTVTGITRRGAWRWLDPAPRCGLAESQGSSAPDGRSQSRPALPHAVTLTSPQARRRPAARGRAARGIRSRRTRDARRRGR